ncbi:molecular chaperone [Acinetobacter sp. WU_MDCI_Axc73]|nr:molecular chaperone [Acinetobacter sp. WU_MDCI_Axc73]
MKAIMIVLTILSILPSVSANAGILAAKTRVVFEEGQRERSIMLANVNDYPVILQAWVDQGEGSPDHSEVPFITLPPVSKMAAKGIQSLRMVYNGQILPSDRETVYWLNLYEIPAVHQPDQDDAYLSLAMNTQMKIFYRPKQLKTFKLADIANQLHFSLHKNDEKWVLECQNPTPYHVSIINIQLSDQTQSIQSNTEIDMMSYPQSQRQYDMNGTLSSVSQYQLSFSLIDDLGNQHEFKKEISFTQP